MPQPLSHHKQCMRQTKLNQQPNKNNPKKGYIGKRYLQRAIDHVLEEPLPNAKRPMAFSILRVPFFLEPKYDETKTYIESNRDRLVQKWGGRKGWEEQKRRHNLKGRGLQAGIPHFNLDRLAANSMASHRLIQYLGKAYGLSISEAIYDRLNRYYFVEGHSLNDRPRLAQVVADELQQLLGENNHSNDNDGIVSTSSPVPLVSANELLQFLNGNEGRQEIETALVALQQMGIHAIPKFIIDGHILVDGAAESETFIRVFRTIEQAGILPSESDENSSGSRSGGSGTVFGDILGVSPEIVQRGSHHVPNTLKN